MNSVGSTKYRKTLEEGAVPPGPAQAHADALGTVLEKLEETLATKDWVRAQFVEFKFDMVKWMISLLAAQIGITIGAVIALIRYLPH